MDYNKMKKKELIDKLKELENTGDWNTGDWNTGYCNTGDWNTGDCNTGHWNAGDCNTGYCNTITPSEVLIFNKLAKKEDWDNIERPDWLYFSMTKWISESDMTDKEKDAYPSYVTTEGYLKCWDSYKLCARDSWDRASEDDRKLTLNLPNFDDEVFEEIFGFSALKELNKEEKVKVKFDDEEIEISKESFEEFKKQFGGK